MVEKTECGVGVQSHESDILFIFIGHKVEKEESRSKIVTKSQQSLLNKSKRIKIRSLLSSDIDRLNCKRFAHVYYQILSDYVFST